MNGGIAVAGSQNPQQASSSQEMVYLKPSADPAGDLERLAMPHQKDNLLKRMYRPGFQHFLKEMPVIDPKQPDQSAQVAATLEVLERIRLKVVAELDQLEIPPIPPGEMGRIILAVEEPRVIDGEIIPGAEVVLALWGEGNTSPVHGHAPGYMHEAMIKGDIDIHMFEAHGELKNREARYVATISQTEPGVFYSNYRRDVGQEHRMEVIHGFRAREFTITLHYLPEHVRDGNGNGIKVVNTPESGALPGYIKTQPYKPGLQIGDNDLTRVSKQEILEQFQVGDVYLIRSQNVSFLGDHFVVITGGLVDKPHGRRPEDLSILVPHGVTTPLDQYKGNEEVIALKLNDQARIRFYEHYEIAPEFRR